MDFFENGSDSTKKYGFRCLRIDVVPTELPEKQTRPCIGHSPLLGTQADSFQEQLRSELLRLQLPL